MDPILFSSALRNAHAPGCAPRTHGEFPASTLEYSGNDPRPARADPLPECFPPDLPVLFPSVGCALHTPPALHGTEPPCAAERDVTRYSRGAPLSFLLRNMFYDFAVQQSR